MEGSMSLTHTPISAQASPSPRTSRWQTKRSTSYSLMSLQAIATFLSVRCLFCVLRPLRRLTFLCSAWRYEQYEPPVRHRGHGPE